MAVTREWRVGRADEVGSVRVFFMVSGVDVEVTVLLGVVVERVRRGVVSVVACPFATAESVLVRLSSGRGEGE